jgi:DNA-binding NarL/FixJ family response regulator
MKDEEPGHGRITVLIADDHSILREGLRGLLEEYDDISVVGEAVTGKDAVEKTRELKPDILLLDLIMPEMGGIDALHILHSEESETKIIILTGADDDDLLTRSIQGGAQGYLLKDSASAHVVEAIRTVAEGNCWLPPGLTEKLFRGMSKKTEVEGADKLSLLTARELEVLKLLGEAKSNSAIAEMLFISEHTVKVHVSRILEKLEIETRAEAVRFAFRHGIAKA